MVTIDKFFFTMKMENRVESYTLPPHRSFTEGYILEDMTRSKITAIVGIVLILSVFTYFKFISGDSPAKPADTAATTPATTATTSEELITNYFGNKVDADFNGDRKEDSAFIITQTGGGSGTFFYLAHTLGGEAIFLGDRIAPQSTEWKSGRLIVNYADRKPNEPMTTKPSVGVTRYFKAEGNTLVEIKSAGSTSVTTEEKCTQQKGTWSAQYKECTGIEKAACTAIGGTFNECASACRNDPNAQACILLCVQVCEFK